MLLYLYRSTKIDSQIVKI